MNYHCNHCGSAVTASFARVFSDRDGKVYRCPHCQDAEAAARTQGGAAGATGGA